MDLPEVLRARGRPIEVLMYQLLRFAARGESFVDVSVRDLAGRSQASEATARRVLSRLEELGAVRIEPQALPGSGERKANRIHLPLERRAAANGNEEPMLFPELAGIAKPARGRTPKGRAQSPGFEEFWRLWPKKVARFDAEKAWDQTVAARPPQATLLAAVEAWVQVWQERGAPEFIPHAATWLRAHRWDDELPPRRGSQAAPPELAVGANAARALTDADKAHALLVAIEEGAALERLARGLQALGCSVPPTEADVERLRAIAEGGEP